MAAYRLLIFDLDGTLVDTAPDIAHYANRVLERYGFPVKPLDEVKRAIGRGVHDLLRDLGFREEQADLEEAVRSFKELYLVTPVIMTRPYPNVQAMLEGPLRKVAKAIATNKPQGVTDRILERLDLRRHFTAVIGEGAGLPRKPDPASVRRIMEGLGAAPAQTILIGDSVIDHQTARNAGTDFLWMDYGYDRYLERDPSVRRSSQASAWADLPLVP